MEMVVPLLVVVTLLLLANLFVVLVLLRARGDRAEAAELLREAQRHGLATVDLLGPLIARAAAYLHAEPRHEPGLLHGLSDEYFQRIEAVEFAVRHDDGANLNTLYARLGLYHDDVTPTDAGDAQSGAQSIDVSDIAWYMQIALCSVTIFL